MLKKCIKCYKNNKLPNKADCTKCDKQLKRLEQENEELKEKFLSTTETLGQATVTNNTLRNKIDDLKIYIESNKQQVEEVETLVMDNARLTQENAELKERLKILDEEDFVYEVTEIEYNNFKKMNKYRKALEEIKEMCIDYAKTEDYIIDQTFNEFLEIIFNRINEVLNKGAEE